MEEKELQELEEALQAASPAPWTSVGQRIGSGDNGVQHVAAGRLADVTLIVMLRNATPSLIGELRSARKLIPPVDHVEALRNQVLSLIDDLRSYTQDWNWKYGETWDRERAEIADVFEERIRLLSGEPAAQPPPDLLSPDARKLREAMKLLREARSELTNFVLSPSLNREFLDRLYAFLGEQSEPDRRENG